MRPPRRHIAQELARVNQRGRAFQAAAKKLEFVAICLIGPEAPVPRFFGDNRGGWPVRVVVTTKDHESAADNDDRGQPYHRYKVLESAHVPSKVHGERLKAALDECLLGYQSELGNDQPRHRFRDMFGCWSDEETRHYWWSIMLDAGIRECRKAWKNFDVFDFEGRQQREARAARR